MESLTLWRPNPEDRKRVEQSGFTTEPDYISFLSGGRKPKHRKLVYVKFPVKTWKQKTWKQKILTFFGFNSN